MQKSNWGFDDIMVIAAFRYCLGRRSYIVGCCIEWLQQIWGDLKQKDRDIICKEIQDARDKTDRQDSGTYYVEYLGSTQDYDAWVHFMEWAKENGKQ